MKLATLRKKHPVFHYYGYQVKIEDKQLLINFLFKTEPAIEFKPTLSLPLPPVDQVSKIDAQVVDQLFFHLGLMEMISYWKTSCSPKIIIHHTKNQQLNKKQLQWWQDLFINGLSEFYFTNQIDFRQKNFLQIKTQLIDNSQKQIKTIWPQLANKQRHSWTNHADYLVPVGGGKDSALTTAILDKAKLAYACLMLAPHSPAATKVCQLNQSLQSISIGRAIDLNLIELNKKGYLNGHTPFSAYLAFLSTTAAYLYGHSQILLANERSANEANQNYKGLKVNHQYSKTFDFEQKFRAYVDENLKPQASKDSSKPAWFPEYLSFLRPLWEIQIAQAFAQYPKYHSIFKSCNVGQKEDVWCETCPKCLFVFIMLFPFIDQAKLCSQIFSENLFEKNDFIEDALKLAGLNQAKPLECVGTYAETQAALYLAVNQYKQADQELPPVLEEVDAQILSKIPDLAKRAQQLLTDWNDEHNLPASLAKLLKQEIAK